MSFFKVIRVAILLTVLVIVAGGQWITRSRMSSWEKPVWMTIYPILVSSYDVTKPYVDSLNRNSFKEIAEFLAQQSGRHGRKLSTPLKLQFAAPGYDLPPKIPPEGERIGIAIWSLKMHWWAWRREREDYLPGADVQMFVLYHSIDEPQRPERSVGVQNGMYGIVNAYASRGYAPGNRAVIAHELLHILGATDKYNPSTGQPLEPDGLANPDRIPLYPQNKAEIMGGRIALSQTKGVMPASLKTCIIGPDTAVEIGWLSP